MDETEQSVKAGTVNSGLSSDKKHLTGDQAGTPNSNTAKNTINKFRKGSTLLNIY